MKRAAIYTRVSTHHQIDKDSLSFQQQELENYSKYVLGIDDFEIFSDAGYSGKNTNRPGYQEMITKIHNNEFTHLLVWKIDRISRNLIDFAKMYNELKNYKVTFVSKNEQFDTSSAMGEAMLKIILVFAELERNLASERVTSIMIDRAQKGLWNGAPTPLGYDYDPETQKLTINADEETRVKFIFNQYEKHGSTSEVKYQLESSGIKTKQGASHWTTKTISQIMRNPIYKGTYRYNYRESGRQKIKDKEEWVLVDDCFPAIISNEQWEKVNQRLTKNYKGSLTNRERNKNTHVFSAIIKCPICNQTFLASPGAKRKDGYIPSIYKCRNYSLSKVKHSKCPHNNFISEVNLGPFILSYIANLVKAKELIMDNSISKQELQSILTQGKYFKEVVGIDSESLNTTYNIISQSGNKTFFEIKKEESQDNNLKLDNLKKEKQKYERALSRLEDLYLFSEDAMSKKDYLIKKKDLQDKIEEINDNIFDINSKNNSPAADLSFIQKASQFLIAKNILQNNINYKKICMTNRDLLKDFIQSIINRILVDDKKVLEIEFINGFKHKFIWEENAKGLKGRI